MAFISRSEFIEQQKGTLTEGWDTRPCNCGDVACEGWCVVPPGAMKNITRNERSDICRWWRDYFISFQPDALRADWDRRIAEYETARKEAREMRRLWTADKWGVFKDWYAAQGASVLPLSQYEKDLIAFVENG